jgi:hypothetical protein
MPSVFLNTSVCVCHGWISDRRDENIYVYKKLFSLRSARCVRLRIVACSARGTRAPADELQIDRPLCWTCHNVLDATLETKQIGKHNKPRLAPTLLRVPWTERYLN